MKRRISFDDSPLRVVKRHSSTVINSEINVVDDDSEHNPKIIDDIELGPVISTPKVLLPRPSSIHSISTDEENDDDDIEQISLLEESSLFCADGVDSASSSLEPEDTDFDTAVVFEAGLKHFDRHNRLHRERPVRVTSVLDFLTNSKQNLTERCRFFDQQLPGEPRAEKAFLEDDDYLSAHLPGYMQRLDRLSKCKCCDRLDDEASQYSSVFFTPDSVSEAKTAATSLCRLVSQVVDGDLDNGFAVIRPPGHHAEPGVAGGFCVINNVAVAAAYARKKLGINKVLVVDWDVHHGNGTQSIFLNDPNVLYFSVHRWEGGNFFPFSSAGGPKVVGSGKGAGYNVNVGWSLKGMGDEEYLAVWERLLMPIAKEFQPELILVSAGFDAAQGDMGECNVTPECFGQLTSSLMTLADGKVVCALEGGYVRSILGKCVESVVSTMLNRRSPEVSVQEAGERKAARGDADVLDCISKTAAKNIRATIAAHQPFWSCLQA